MSCPDYEQSILHHSYLLVLLRGVGPAKPRSLQKAFDKVRHVNNVKITDNSGTLRDIWIRYVYDYPVENNDWGDFQTHRRIIGLVTIGKFETQTELNELCRQHEMLKVRYYSTLYESRAIFFGPPLTTEKQTMAELCTTTTTSSMMNNTNSDIKEHSMCSSSGKQNQCNRLFLDEFTTPDIFKAKAFFYRENDVCLDLESHLHDFVNALFWILESRRLNGSKQKPEKCHLLTAPFEKREVVGLDRESRNSKKRITGRMLKNLADLSLQAGLIEDALSLYHNACDTLKSTMDFLWEGAAEEGLCAASALLLYPHLRSEETLRRNASLQESSPLRNHVSENVRVGDKSKGVNIHNRFNHHGMPLPPPHSASTSSIASILTNSTLSQISPGSSSNTSSSSTTTTSNSTLSATGQGNCSQHSELPGNILKADEIPVYFHKAIINYSKYSMAAIIEIETSFKAARISIEQNRPLDVAMVLQNILSINHNLNETERINMFKMMTFLYQQIGYMRKASFFQRLVALEYSRQHHYQNQNPISGRPDWLQMYNHILASFPGYMLSLDPLEVLQYTSGWPAIQIDLIQNLIMAAKSSGQIALAIRHMTFLLQTQWHNLTETERKEMAEKLKSLSEQCEGSPVPLVLENGTVIPPANLTDLPYCLEMTVKDLPAPAKPQLLKIDKTESGPFLFTPLQFNSLDRRDKQKDKHKIAFYWVQNNITEVQVRLRNPLPFELIVTDMRLLTNGIVFKSLPQTVTLQPTQYDAHCVSLYGTPIEVGELEIQGYSTHTLGVKSNCRLKHMKDRKFPPYYLIKIIPELPYITLKTSLPQTATFYNTMHKGSEFVIASASLTLHSGESSSFIVTIVNDTCIPVEHLELNITSNMEDDIQNRIFTIDHNEIQSKLPIAAKSSIDFIVNIFAETDFIYAATATSNIVHSAHTVIKANKTNVAPTTQYSNYSHPQNHQQQHSRNTYSLPVTIKSSHQHQQYFQYGKNTDINYSSFRSTISSPLLSSTSLTSSTVQGAVASLPTNLMPLDTICSPVQQLEAQFHFKYSGGNAMIDGYCRQCALSFHLDFLPSVTITNWDVLSAEVPSQFYLVLDINNLTAQEMSLNYTINKNILIGAKESCRVPIPIERVTLEQVSAAKEAEIAENLEKELCFRTNNKDAVAKLCSKHITERVNIEWLLTGTNIHGTANLRGITFTQAMLDLCTISPLHWNISFKGESIQPQSEIVCVAGESSPMAVTIYNQSLKSLRNLQLTIKFYQDYLNGIENHNLDARVTITGPNRFYIPILKEGEKAHHECTVLFLTPGRFKTNIQCHAKSSNLLTQTCIASRTLDVGRHCPRKNSPEQQQQLQHYDYHEDEQDHTWKVIPPIEVTVTESQ